MRESSPKFPIFVSSEGIWMSESGSLTRLERNPGLGLVFSSCWGKDWASFRGSEGVLAKIWGRPALASSSYTFLKVSRPSNNRLVMLFLLLNAAWQLIEVVVASRDRIGE